VPREEWTDGKGRLFKLGLEPDVYAVIAWNGLGKTDRIGNLELRAGEIVGPIELRLEAGGEIAGRALTSQGVAIPTEVTATWSLSPTSKFSARTDGEGYFSMAGLPEGPFRLSVDTAGYRIAKQVSLQVPQGERVWHDLVLVRETILEGAVRDASGMPRSGIFVFALQGRGARVRAISSTRRVPADRALPRTL
jgi:hypothetical protein